MTNPIPARVRQYLYLCGVLASTVAAGGLLDEFWTRITLVAVAALGTLAAANVSIPGDDA